MKNVLALIVFLFGDLMKKISMFAAIVALGLSSVAHAQAGYGTAVSDTPPTCKTPQYPKVAFLNGEEGRVVMSVLVDANGKVIDTKLDKSSGYWNLDRASKHALVKCEFKTATPGKTEWQKIGFTWNIEA